jgi:hypothetical protein
MSNTALSKAVGEDGKVKTDNPNVLKHALQAPTDLVDKGTKKVERMQERAEHALGLGIMAGEVQGTAFVASVAEGYLGEEKIKFWGVDARAGLAIGLQGWGLYEAFTGRGENAGAHQVGIGAGMGASYLSSVGSKLGAELRVTVDKRRGGGGADKPAAAGAAASSPSPAQAALPAPVPQVELPQGAGASAPKAEGAIHGRAPVRERRAEPGGRAFERFRKQDRAN